MDEGLIRDPLLLSVLEAASRTRSQCLTILDFLDDNALQSRSISPEPNDEASYALARHQKRLTSRLAHFRGLFRNAALSGRATKQETSEAKSEIDTLHLQLQNLLYEQRHLKGEIAACEDYNHSYKALSLLPLEEAQSSNPSLSNIQTEHDLMLARIEDERSRRQAQEDERSALLKHKEALLLANKAKKDELDTLDKEIEKFVAAAGPVQRILEARESAELKTTIETRADDGAGIADDSRKPGNVEDLIKSQDTRMDG